MIAARRARRSLRAFVAEQLLNDQWVPVVDVSQHQGAIDFRRMRAEGVEGLILRATHGLDVDDRALVNYEQARAAGFAGDQIGWYPFINPKRGSGAQCAEALCSTILRATSGEWAPFTMVDAESYAKESPRSGTAPITGQAYASWLREHEATTAAILPETNRIGYTNAAFWNPTVGDPLLAASFDWIVPRYPVYTPLGYIAHPLPGPSGWHEWAAYWLARGKGPLPPEGGDWEGWQFSAGWNRQGARYGCESRDLDLNIVRRRAWLRWTTRPTTPTPTPPPSQEDDMKPRLIQTPGDAAVFATDGISAVWAVSGPTIVAMQGAGVWDVTPTQTVPRSALKALTLVGPEPDYTGVDPSLTGRTTRADFAATPAPTITGTVKVSGDVSLGG